MAIDLAHRSLWDTTISVREASGLVLPEATAYWKATDYDAANDRLTDLAGNGLHARLGSAVGADTNDPLRLVYSGEKYLYSAASNNKVVVPDSPAISISGDIDMRMRVALPDWTPSGTVTLADFDDGGSNRAWGLRITAAGRVNVFLSNDGTTLDQVTSSSPLSDVVANDVPVWLRWTWRQSDGRLQFLWHPDQATAPAAAEYTQLGVDSTVPIASIFDANASLDVGITEGRYYYFDLRNGIDGTVVASFDANSSTLVEPYATWTDPQGNVWNFNRPASGRKLAVVDRTMLLFGTDDYLEVPDDALLDFAAGDSFTAVALLRRYGSPSATHTLFAKKAAAGASTGWRLAVDTSKRAQGSVSDGTVNTQAVSAALPDGVLTLASVVRNVGADTVQAFADGTGGTATADATTGTLANAEVMRAGRLSGAGTEYGDFVFVAGAVFRRALSAAELTGLKTELMAA